MKIKEYSQACTIWLQFKDKLQHYILKKVRDKEIAEEINHEVLQKLLNACCADKEIKNLSSWLFQIAHHTTIDHLKDKNFTTILNAANLEIENTNPFYQEMSEFIEPLLNFIPDKYAVPLKLADLEKLKLEEVAQQLNLSLAATKSRVQRARKMLKKEIETCFYLEEIGEQGLSDFVLKNSCKSLEMLKMKEQD